MPKRRFSTKKTPFYPACMFALRRISLPESAIGWLHIVQALQQIRGSRFAWSHRKTASRRYARIWIEKNESLLDWALSDSCLLSPRRWPDHVLPAFKYRLIPSPYEITNVNMVTRLGMSCAVYDLFLVVILYGLGFSVPKIAIALKTSEQQVLDSMYEAISYLFTLPQFVIWTTATNFREAIIPPSLLDMPTQDRLATIDTLDRNPFLVDTNDAAKLIESPAYLSYLIYGTSKRSRLSFSCRNIRTTEANDDNL
jgi:hypothetical protein